MLLALQNVINNSGVKFGTSGARGLVENMTFQVCYAYVSAFMKSVVGKLNQKQLKVIIGHDLRPSSPQISLVCIQAITDAGYDVLYSGNLPTPALAFYGQKIGAPVIVVTGSHIPFDRNGVKFYKVEGEISKADESAILESSVDVPDNPSLLGLPIVDQAAYKVYLSRYLDFFGEGKFSGMRVAIYEHSSVARDFLKDLLHKLGAEVISLGRTDSFVPIDTEAVRDEDVAQAKKWADEYKFDAILSTDGDADRPLIGDESGNFFRGDVVGILCAKYLCADVVVTPVSSNTALEKSHYFKKTVRTKIGSPYVIAGMEESANAKSVVIGFEANGGFLLGSDVEVDGRHLERLPTRDAVLPMLALLAMARESGCKLSELKTLLPSRFTHSDRLQEFSVEESAKLLNALKADLSDASAMLAPELGEIVSVDLTDGFRATFSNEDVVHIRPSGNAPELRCYAESSTEEAAVKLCNACLDRIKALA